MERELAGLRRRIRDIENLERQNSQVAIRANSQSSSLQNRLKATEEKFDLSVNVLNSCKSIMTSMQGQLEAKDAQLGVLINRSNELIDEFNQLQVVNATNAANLANTQTYLNEVRNELQNRSQQLITLAETHNNLRVEKAQSDTRAEFFSGQVVRTENELQTTKTNLEEVR
jgi:chromosome segregation ATPase